MAGSLKTIGLEELSALRKRVLRQHQLGRISRGDKENLITKMDDVEAYIVKMKEGKERLDDYFM
jgi:hypothetical protein